MIFGSIGGATSGLEPFADLEAWASTSPDSVIDSLRDGNVHVGMTSSGAPALDSHHIVHEDAESRVAIALYGQIHDHGALARSLGVTAARDGSLGALIAAGYAKLGSGLFGRLNGSFILVVNDRRAGRVWIARDHLGIESVYYRHADDRIDFCSDLRPLVQRSGGELDERVLLRYLLLNYNPGFETFFRGVSKLRPGHALRIEGGRIETERYWRLSFRDPSVKSGSEYRDELRALMEDAVRIRVEPTRRAGAYLSGGMDSSSVVCLMARAGASPIHTFSFRCAGKSFDESGFARAVSEHCATVHHEVPYRAPDAHRILELVELLDEPLADVGIEVATFLLAREASGTVDYILTGDGGDELFAGHPVYAADRMAARFEALPGFVRTPITTLLQLLPDGKQKKSLLIKARRFAYSIEFPAEWYSNRWRIYYKSPELSGLLTPDWRGALEGPDPLDMFRTIYGEADGPDTLSRTLYGDYQTVVDFYLRRMQTVRALGLTARFPLFDHRLVEYAARIPSNLKVTSDAATKFLLHDAMSDVLPRAVLDRKDKLGNSVPLKNWLREATELHELVSDHLSPDAIRRRGIFDPAAVDRMWREHRRGRENHSHRIWSLLVFELWCRANLDRPSRPPIANTTGTTQRRREAS